MPIDTAVMTVAGSRSARSAAVRRLKSRTASETVTTVPSEQRIVFVPFPFGVIVHEAGVPFVPSVPLLTVAEVPSGHETVAEPLPLSVTVQDFASAPLSPAQPAIARVPARSSAPARLIWTRVIEDWSPTCFVERTTDGGRVKIARPALKRPRRLRVKTPAVKADYNRDLDRLRPAQSVRGPSLPRVPRLGAQSRASTGDSRMLRTHRRIDAARTTNPAQTLRSPRTQSRAAGVREGRRAAPSAQAGA